MDAALVSRIDNFLGPSIIYPRFTKRTFVREKNTQRLDTAYLIQFFSLNMDMNSILKLIQRFRLNFNFLIFFKMLTHIFCIFFCLSPNCRKFHQESRNFVVRCFCLFQNDEQHFAEHKSMKMKIDLHLEVVAWIKDMNLYLKPVGKMGLCKNLKVLGYFCLEQTCYLGIVQSWYEQK